MSDQYDNSGALFKNKDKKGNQPDFRGPLKVDGVEYEMSGWQKKSSSGDSYLSLAIQVKDAWKKDKQDEPTSDDNPEDLF